MSRRRRRSAINAHNSTSSQENRLQPEATTLDIPSDLISDNRFQPRRHVDGFRDEINPERIGVGTGVRFSARRGEATHSRYDPVTSVRPVRNHNYVFEEFNRSCSELLSELIRFDYALRSVGSGGPCMDAASCLRKPLREVQRLFKVNTTFLFDKNSTDISLDYLADFPDAISDLANAVIKFGESLLDFVDGYYNEKLMRLLDHLSKMLQFYAKLLEEKKFASYTELRLYLHDILPRLDAAFMTFTNDLTIFVDIGAPMIRIAQKNQTDRYAHVTTIATFLSAVTASTLQIETQGGDESSAINAAVISFFFLSLIFSTASAVQSILAMTWLRSYVRIPERRLPRWVFAWLTNGPTVSLFAAGAFFSSGLVLFVYSSHQNIITSIFTTFFATIQTLGVLALTIWFIHEKWKFRVEHGDTGVKLTESSVLLDVVAAGLRLHRSLRRPISRLWCFLTSSCRGKPAPSSRLPVNVDEETILATSARDSSIDDQEGYYSEHTTDHRYHMTVPMTDISLHAQRRGSPEMSNIDQNPSTSPPTHNTAIPSVARQSEQVTDTGSTSRPSASSANLSLSSHGTEQEVVMSEYQNAIASGPDTGSSTPDMQNPSILSSEYDATVVESDASHGDFSEREYGSKAFPAYNCLTRDGDETPPGIPRASSSHELTGIATRGDVPSESEVPLQDEIRSDSDSDFESATDILVEPPSRAGSVNSTAEYPAFAGTFDLGDSDAALLTRRPPSPSSDILDMDARPENTTSFGARTVDEPLVMSVTNNDNMLTTSGYYPAAQVSNRHSRFGPLLRYSASSALLRPGENQLTELSNVISDLRQESISLIEIRYRRSNNNVL